MEDRCIMPEMPYCPACEYGYVEYLNETDTIWHCMVDDCRKSKSESSKEEAWQKIQCYIDCCNYDWTLESIREDYQKYYMTGAYCSHTLLDIIKHNETECRLLFGDAS